MLAKLRAMVMANKPDISTPKGRTAIKSVCYKIARSSTGLDAMGKDLGDRLRAQLNPILAERRKIREGCDALAEEYRAGLTKWEADEAERIEGHELALDTLQKMDFFESMTPSSEEIKARIAEFDADALKPYNWQEFVQRAVDLRKAVREELTKALTEATEREAAEAEATENCRRTRSRTDRRGSTPAGRA